MAAAYRFTKAPMIHILVKHDGLRVAREREHRIGCQFAPQFGWKLPIPENLDAALLPLQLLRNRLKVAR